MEKIKKWFEDLDFDVTLFDGTLAIYDNGKLIGWLNGAECVKAYDFETNKDMRKGQFDYLVAKAMGGVKHEAIIHF